MPEQDVADRLTSFYRSIDAAIPERAPAWQLDVRRPVAGGFRFQLLVTAALLVLIAVVAILITEARLKQTPTPADHRPGATLSSGITLHNPVHPMGLQDGQHGWVVTMDRLLQTADGGRHWRETSPPGTETWCCAVFFLDAQRGWAGGAYSSSSRVLKIFRTTDGGTSWQQVGAAGPAASPSACCPTLDFVDGRHGWLIYGDVETSGVRKLLRTADGGATWSDLPDLPSPLALHGGLAEPEIALLRFVNTSKGWYVGYNAAGSEALYITRDGGRTWAEQALPVPASEQLANQHLTTPGFLKSGEGVLPVSLDDDTIMLEFSEDGGASWHMDPARAPLFHRPSAPETVGLYQLVPTYVGNGLIAIVLGDQIELNTGTGWMVTKTSGLPGVIVDIQFANARLGWALSTHGQSVGAGADSRSCNGPICGSNNVVLMETTDGGATWSRLGS